VKINHIANYFALKSHLFVNCKRIYWRDDEMWRRFETIL